MTEPEQNENCLDGMKCPKCKSLGPFLIEVKCIAVMTDEGEDDIRDIDWEDTSFCECDACSFNGTVKDFKSEDSDNEKS